jgi:Flp pilus assembly protein TadB
VLPDFLTGKETEFTKRLTLAEGIRDYKNEIEKEKIATLKKYLLIVLLLALATAGAFASSANENAAVKTKIERSAPLGKTKKEELKVIAEKDGEKIEKDVLIEVQPKKLSYSAKVMRIEEALKNAEKNILGENSSLDNLTGSLNLYEKDKETGAEMKWTSANEDALSSDGKLSSVIAKPGMTLTLSAVASLGDLFKEKILTLKVGKKIDSRAGDIEAAVMSELAKKNADDSGDFFTLPKEIAGGIKLRFKSAGSAPVLPIAIGALFILVLIFSSRYKSLEKRLREKRGAMEREFPAFAQKFVLLLSAGASSTAAFRRITEDYEAQRDAMGKKYLYEEFSALLEKIKNSNESFAKLLSDLATRSNSIEIMRFAGLVSDNVGKGTELTAKLENETRTLFDSRLKNAKRKGEIAESKLVLPMSLLLLSILIITIAPVGMTM